MTRSSASEATLRRLERRVVQYVAAHGLLLPDLRVLLLLSGGADSMALLELVRHCDRELGLHLRLGALHVDYAMRGADSLRDRRIVEAACVEADIPLELIAPERGMSGPDFQERARRLRLSAARRLLESGGYDVIATGHNLDDQAETVLYRLAKYGAPSALVGMPPRSGRQVRPLLCLRAAEVRDYCRGRAIAFGDDYTNAEQKYSRNVVRLAALPQLERLNPRAAEALAAAAEAARLQQELLEQLTDDAWARVARLLPTGQAEPVTPTLDLVALAREPEALRALLLRRLALSALGENVLLERRVTDALLVLASGRAGTRRVRLRDGWEAVREYDRLSLRRKPLAEERRAGKPRRGAAQGHAAAVAGCTPSTVSLPVPGGGEARAAFCGRRFMLRLQPGGDPGGAVGRVALGVDRPAATVTLRHPLPGERFVPLGLGAETGVARFLREQKVPASARAHALVVELDGQVAWVETPAAAGSRQAGVGTPAGGGPQAPVGLPAVGRVAESFRVTQSSAFTVFVSEQVDA